MPLTGDLDTIPLASVLQLLSNEQLTGVLRIKKDEIEYQLFILNGDIIYGIQPQKKSRLGYLLLKKKIITKTDLNDCLSIAKQKKLALGKVLIEQQIITKEKLEKMICKQIEDILFTLFLWDSGKFDFQQTNINLRWLVVFKLNILKLILNASRRVDMMPILTKQIPNDSIVFKVSEKNKNRENKKLHPVEVKILTLIDGTRNVKDIIHKSGYDDFSIYKILYSFISTGLIEK